MSSPPLPMIHLCFHLRIQLTACHFPYTICISECHLSISWPISYLIGLGWASTSHFIGQLNPLLTWLSTCMCICKCIFKYTLCLALSVLVNFICLAPVWFQILINRFAFSLAISIAHPPPNTTSQQVHIEFSPFPPHNICISEFHIYYTFWLWKLEN